MHDFVYVIIAKEREDLHAKNVEERVNRATSDLTVLANRESTETRVIREVVNTSPYVTLRKLAVIIKVAVTFNLSYIKVKVNLIEVEVPLQLYNLTPKV